MMKLEDIRRLYIFVDSTQAFSREGLLADPYVLHTVPELIEIAKIGTDDEAGKLMFIVDLHTKDSLEFDRYPIHALEGTKEVEIIPELKIYTENSLIFKKNATSAIFSKGFINTILKMTSLEKVIISGWDTDICVMNLAIPLQNLFDEINRRVEIIVPPNAVETYDSPDHNRDEYNEMAFKFMRQSGIKVRTLERKDV